MDISTTDNGIIIFRWASQDQSEIDQWFHDLNTRYRQTNPPKRYRMMHILNINTLPSLRHAALRLRQLEANHPDRSPTDTAVCLNFSFQLGVMRQIAQLFIRKGDRVEFFQLNETAKATEWLRGQGSALQS